MNIEECKDALCAPVVEGKLYGGRCNTKIYVGRALYATSENKVTLGVTQYRKRHERAMQTPKKAMKKSFDSSYLFPMEE
jgi:hypothetical protein